MIGGMRNDEIMMIMSMKTQLMNKRHLDQYIYPDHSFMSINQNTMSPLEIILLLVSLLRKCRRPKEKGYRGGVVVVVVVVVDIIYILQFKRYNGIPSSNQSRRYCLS